MNQITNKMRLDDELREFMLVESWCSLLITDQLKDKNVGIRIVLHLHVSKIVTSYENPSAL
jgi:hypothetical protein